MNINKSFINPLSFSGKDPEQEKLERRKELTIGELADEFLKFKLPFLKQATRNSYKSAVKKHIKPDLGKIPIKAFRHSDAQRYYNDLLMGKGITIFHSEKEDFRHIGSANTVLLPLRCMFDYARSLGLMDFNPVKELLLQMKDAVQQAADKITRRIAALLNIPEQCAKPEDVKMFPLGIYLYKLHLVKPGEYPRPMPARKQRAAG